MKTLFEDDRILVRKNDSDEIFYCYKPTGAEVRMFRNIILTWNGLMIPTSHNGLAGMRMLKFASTEGGYGK